MRTMTIALAAALVPLAPAHAEEPAKTASIVMYKARKDGDGLALGGTLFCQPADTVTLRFTLVEYAPESTRDKPVVTARGRNSLKVPCSFRIAKDEYPVRILKGGHVNPGDQVTARTDVFNSKNVRIATQTFSGEVRKQNGHKSLPPEAGALGELFDALPIG